MSEFEPAVTYSSRSKMPLLTRPGATYAVTFCLFDAWAGRVAMERNGARYEELDGGYGECHLRNPILANLVNTALGFFSGNRYELYGWVVMPNHVHAVVQPFENHSLSNILQSWKGFTAHEANRILDRRGPFWQRESWTRIIRDERHMDSALNYMWLNPVKAGLVADPAKWPWSGPRD